MMDFGGKQVRIFEYRIDPVVINIFNPPVKAILFLDPDNMSECFAVDARCVERIPEKPLYGHFYVPAHPKEMRKRYEDEIIKQFSIVDKFHGALSKYSDEQKDDHLRKILTSHGLMPLNLIIPEGNFWEIDATVPVQVISVKKLGIEATRLPVDLSSEIIEFVGNRIERKKRSPIESIRMSLSEQDLESSKLKRWVRRKLGVLKTLLENDFSHSDIAEFFGLTPDELENAIGKIK